ncbi:MAG: DUF5110 domain-containing protein [Clostridia bacterium]|nr:DUF5110 domain-containing protein [Clostridia bacterium]
MGSKPHEPWAFGEEVEAVCKKYIELRYQLLPYHYNEFYKASKTGLPIMKPLVLEYPGDENVHNLCDQFLYGESILVAPVYRPSTTKRCVYLPEGAWYNYWTNEKHEGGRYIIADASIDILPMYIKAGAVIPTIREMNYVGEKKANSLTLDIYTGNDGKYSLYEDDGVSYGYRDGKYSVTEIEQSSEAELLKLRIDPVVMGYETGRDSYILKIHGLGKKPVQINGTKVYTVVYDQGEDILKIELKDIKAEQVLRIQY